MQCDVQMLNGFSIALRSNGTCNMKQSKNKRFSFTSQAYYIRKLDGKMKKETQFPPEFDWQENSLRCDSMYMYIWTNPLEKYKKKSVSCLDIRLTNRILHLINLFSMAFNIHTYGFFFLHKTVTCHTSCSYRWHVCK